MTWKEVEQVETCKYLSVVPDTKRTWKNNTNVIVSKIKTRMCYLRKLRSFNINPDLLQIFYSSLISSVLSFALICSGGSIQEQDQHRLDKIVRKERGGGGGIVDLKKGRTTHIVPTTYHKQNVRNRKRSHVSSVAER